jgi:hypothetical protein
VVDNDHDNDGFTGSTYGGPDCNDDNASVHPGATEICGDGIDQDCNGCDLACVADADGDGSPANVDCNDNDASRYPGAPEHCNDIDDDCDGVVDDGISCGGTTVPDPASETITITYTPPEGMTFGNLVFRGHKYADGVMVDFCSTGFGDVSVSGRTYTCIAHVAPGWRDRHFQVDIESPNGLPYQATETWFCSVSMGTMRLLGTLTVGGETMAMCNAVDNWVGGCNAKPNAC